MIIPEEQVREALRTIKRNQQLDAVLAVIQDEAAMAHKRMSVLIRKGGPLTPEEWPRLQLDQGRIQALQDVLNRIEAYTVEAEPPKIRAVEG